MTLMLTPMRGAALAVLAATLTLWPAPLALAQPAASSPTGDGYVLRAGDALTVQLVGEEKLTSLAQPIRPDGRISLPLVGEVQAGSSTIADLTARLGRAYAPFLRDPHVVVSVATFKPLKVNVIGMVNKPGTYGVTEPVRLLEALALAGGLDRDRARTDHVVVIQADGQRRQVDLARILAGEAPDAIWLHDGDTLQVNEQSGPGLYRLLPATAAGLSILASILVMVTR